MMQLLRLVLFCLLKFKKKQTKTVFNPPEGCSSGGVRAVGNSHQCSMPRLEPAAPVSHLVNSGGGRGRTV